MTDIQAYKLYYFLYLSTLSQKTIKINDVSNLLCVFITHRYQSE